MIDKNSTKEEVLEVVKPYGGAMQFAIINEIRIKKIYIHKTKDNIKIPIHRLKTDHLANIIRYANKNPEKTNKKYLDVYKNELLYRYNYPDELIMNELNRFSSIKKTECKCIKPKCDGWLYTYATEKTQTFCTVCWQQYEITRKLSGIIEEGEFNSMPFPEWWKY